MDDQGIKPCPFCGGRGALVYIHGPGHEREGESVTVTCHGCEAKISHPRYRYDGFELINMTKQATDFVVSRWNARYGSDASVIDDLENRIAQLAMPHIRIESSDFDHRRGTLSCNMQITEDACRMVPIGVIEREVRSQTERMVQNVLRKVLEIQRDKETGEAR